MVRASVFDRIANQVAKTLCNARQVSQSRRQIGFNFNIERESRIAHERLGVRENGLHDPFDSHGLQGNPLLAIFRRGEEQNLIYEFAHAAALVLQHRAVPKQGIHVFDQSVCNVVCR